MANFSRMTADPQDRAEKLRAKCLELSLKINGLVNESEVVCFLIDNGLSRLEVDREGYLTIL